MVTYNPVNDDVVSYMVGTLLKNICYLMKRLRDTYNNNKLEVWYAQ